MIDIEAVRKRSRQPTPPLMPPGEGETAAQGRDRDITNRWMREWHRDRQDLHAALDEIEILRKSTSPELVALLRRWVEAKNGVSDLEAEMRTIVVRTSV
jgi:hypothetical protein